MSTFDGFDLFTSRWKLASSSTNEQRTNELADLAFESGEHWDATEKAERIRDGKPCLTIDLLSGPIKQVTNQQRTARPGIKISPVGTGDTKKAEVWQGLLRRVERLSKAERAAYPWAGQHQAKMGRGVWVIRNQYVGDSDEQDIRIEEVDNQHTVYVDPMTKKLDGSDKKWAIRFEDLSHDEYKDRFGESALASALVAGKSFSGLGAVMPEWATSETVRIAEYYYLKTTSRTKVFFDDTREDGSEPMEHAFDDELERGPATRDKGKFAKGDYKLPKGVTVRTSRKVTTTEVRWCLLNGLGEELDSARIPGQYIPVVQIYGERRNINGKVDMRGMVRMAKDPSRMEDFCESSLMEAIADAKTAPWLAEFTQLEGLESIWGGKTPKVLPYHRQSGLNGAPIPPPQKVSSGVDVTAITLAAQRMQNHVRTIAGQSDTFQEETGSLQGQLSGRAIDKRRQIQELGTSDYMEGLGDGIVLTARIIMSMGAEVWDTPRVMRILDNKEQERPVVTHKGADQLATAQQLRQQHEIGEDDVFDLDDDPEQYDIAIAPGRNYDTQRQETVDTLSSLIPNLPPPMQIRAIPVLIKNMDGPGMQELAAALEPDQQDAIPPQVAQRMQEMEQQLQQAAQIIQTDQVKQQATIQTKQAEVQAKVYIEQMNADLAIKLQEMKDAAAIEIAKINAQVKGVLLERQAELESLATGQQMAHEARQAAADRHHEMRAGQQAAEHGAVAADQQHQQGLEAGAVAHQQNIEAGDRGHQQTMEAQEQAAKLAPKPAAKEKK